MAWNIIITCGTSQIEPEKLGCIEENVGPKKISAEGVLEEISTEERREERQKLSRLNDYAEKLRNATGVDTDENYFQQVIGESKQLGGNLTEQEEYCRILVDALVNRWHAIADKIGTAQNPFGAEISSLYVLEKQFNEEGTPLDVDEDFIVLLYSQTESGAFCAGVLYHLLHKLMEFRQDHIIPKIVRELTEDPKKPEKALQYLAHLAADSCESSYDNIFIVTGGYKYMSSTVGLVAQLANIPHYYLFEYSKCAYNLTLSADLIPNKEELCERMESVREYGETPENADIPFILWHPETNGLNALGEILYQRCKTEPIGQQFRY